MTDEAPAKRGDAAWKEQKDAISRRNAETHKRAQVEKKSRDHMIAERVRADAQRESAQLRDLNARIAKQQGRRGQR